MEREFLGCALRTPTLHRLIRLSGCQADCKGCQDKCRRVGALLNPGFDQKATTGSKSTFSPPSYLILILTSPGFSQ